MKSRFPHSGRHGPRAVVIALATLVVSGYAQAASSGNLTLGTNASAIQAEIETILSVPTARIAPLPDIPGGAANATIVDASLFAWQEFIALNWPNVPVTGAVNTRETADRTKQFGQPASAYLIGDATAAYPAVVWETLRSKTELFGGLLSPSTALLPPNGYINSADLSFGFDGLPQYNYQNGISPGYSATTPAAPFVNLDENSQIGTCQMFSGVPVSDTAPTGNPGRLVLFLAKGNRAQYNYVSSRQWWSTTSANAVGAIANNTSGYVVANQKLPPAGAEIGTPANPGPYISFPNGTIEVKAGWRLLTANETASYNATKQVPGYHVAMVRYYPTEQAGTTPGTAPGSLVGDPTKAVDAPGVLLGLHIIQKTPSAPYFIYATFEHVSNIRDQSGNTVEDMNGDLTGKAYTTSAPTPTPADFVLQGDATGGNPPQGSYLKDATASNVFTQFATAGNPEGENFVPNETTNSAGLGAQGSSSYYINTRNSGLPADQSSAPSIDVNRRRFLIPATVVQINKLVHGLIAKYGYNGDANVWLNYRLTNVQWKPVNKPAGQAYTTAINGVPPASYYQSNSMIETNIVLSGFSGQFAGQTNNITDFYFQNTTYTDTNPTPNTSVTRTASTAAAPSPFYNVYHAGTANNMGGCMGCHGNRSVGLPPGNGATDFSFIFAGGPVANPDQSAAAFTPTQQEALKKKLRAYFH